MGVAFNPEAWARAHPPAYTQATLPGGQQVPSSPSPIPGQYTGAGGTLRGDIAAAMPPSAPTPTPPAYMPTPGGGVQPIAQAGPSTGPLAPPMQQPAPAQGRRTIADILSQVMQRSPTAGAPKQPMPGQGG